MPESKPDASVSRDTAAAGARCDTANASQTPLIANANAAARVDRRVDGPLADIAHQRLEFRRAIRVAIRAAELIGKAILFTSDLAVP